MSKVLGFDSAPSLVISNILLGATALAPQEPGSGRRNHHRGDDPQHGHSYAYVR